jgi:hypothetical protein
MGGAMEIEDLPIQQIGYCTHLIELSAVLIDEKWYPLFRILTLDRHQIHPWHVPDVDGVSNAPLAAEIALLTARQLLDKCSSYQYWSHLGN